MNSLGVLVIHGMGSQMPGYSAAMKDELERSFPIGSSSVAWEEVLWADVLRSREINLLDAMSNSPQPLNWASLREFAVHSFGDALAYHRSHAAGSAYSRVHDVISGSVDSLQSRLSPRAPIIVIAHSLGAHMISNYIWDQQHGDNRSPVDNLLSMISIGNNIPLFSLDFPDAISRPITLPRSPLARWLNFYDRDDVLGWPLRPLYEGNLVQLTPEQQATVGCIQDCEINVGNLATSWNPMAHMGYWTDNDFTGPVTDYFLRVFDSL
ncbi:MAG: hypothetical protein ACI8W8_001488 [Rhodothermales bacterium]|jgi:hypothetical protein